MKTVINIAHQKSCPQYFVLLIPLNKKKIITSNKLNMGFQICSKFGSLINSQSLNYRWSVLLDQIPLQSDMKGIKEREDGERGGSDYS